MAEPFSVSAHASAKNIEVWAKAQGSNTKIESKVGQDGQTVLYAQKMGRFEAMFHRTTKSERVQAAHDLVSRALQNDKPIVQKGGVKSAEQLWKAPTFDSIPKEIRQSPRFMNSALALGKALQGEDAHSLYAAAEDFAQVLGGALSKQPFSTQMHFAISDAKSLCNMLLPQISLALKASQERTGESGPPLPVSTTGLGRVKEDFLMQTMEYALSHLSDKIVGKGEIMVGGNRYLESKQLGQGQFGSVSVYTAVGQLKPGNPRTLAVKTPMVAGNDPDFRDKAINAPLLEARALVNGTGTGGAELGGNLAKFQSAIRGPGGEVMVVMRVEEGPSTSKVSEGALARLNSNDPNQKISEQQYENLNITLFKDALQGAVRLHQGAQLIHYDLKPDNWLIDGNGRVKLADPGSSRTALDQSLDSPNGILHPIPYAAPEALAGAARSTASDVWSLGMVLFEMMSKKGAMSLIDRSQSPILHGANTPTSYGELKQMIIDFGQNPANMLLRPQDIPQGSLLAKFAPLINAMTNPDAKRRPTLEQVLAHPLLNQPGFGGDDIRGLVKSFGSPPPQTTWSDTRPGSQPGLPGSQPGSQGVQPGGQQVNPQVNQTGVQQGTTQVVQPGDGFYGSLYGNSQTTDETQANLRALNRLRPNMYDGDMPEEGGVDEDLRDFGPLRGENPYGQPIPIGQTVPDLRDFGPLRGENPYGRPTNPGATNPDLRDFGPLRGDQPYGRIFSNAPRTNVNPQQSNPLRNEQESVGEDDRGGYTGVRDNPQSGYTSVRDLEKNS